MVSDCTHFTPEQSFPEGMDSLASHIPSQAVVGSNGVCGVDALFNAQVAAFAVIVEGKLHEPVGDVQEHVPQSMGASRSAKPS
jgi:hypothetical protein